MTPKLSPELHREVMNFLIVSLGYELANAFGKADRLELVPWIFSSLQQFDRSFSPYPLSPGPGGQVTDSLFYQFAKDLASELGYEKQVFVVGTLSTVGIGGYRSLPFNTLLRRVRPSP
jgi:hypothetical protein